MKKGAIGGIALGVVIVTALILVIMCAVKVPAGYVAVKYNMNGGIQDDVLTQGWHIVSPSVSTTKYTVGIEQSYLTSGSNGDSKDNESFSASSSEGKAIQIDLTFTYQYQQDRVAEIFTKFKGQDGTEVRDSFIKPNIISWTKEVVARYKVSDIIGEKRADVNKALTDYLHEKFDVYGISVNNVSLINIEVDGKTMEAINAKITAQQDAETQSIKNKTAIDKAEADAQVKKTNAQAEADAKLIKAKADAEANQKLSQSITDKLIENNKIEKWDGKLPVYSGNGSSLIIDSRDIMTGDNINNEE